MKRQRGSSNLDTITTRNLSAAYPVLMIRNYLNTLKASGTDYHLKWSKKSYASRYKCGTRRCNLCLTEKNIIALADPKVLLNKRTKLMSKCRHRNKFILNKVK